MNTPEIASTPVGRIGAWARFTTHTVTRNRRLLATTAGVSLIATAGLGLVVATNPGDHAIARSVVAEPLPTIAAEQPSGRQFGPTLAYPPDIARARACGSISVIDPLTTDELTPERTPGQPAARPADGNDLIGHANALNAIERAGLSGPMSAAITAHAYAITNLGSMINHGSDPDDIDSMTVVVDVTRAVLDEFCHE